MARTILFLVAISLAFLGRTSADVTIGGARPTVLHVPASYDPSVPTPLFIFLHGYGGSGANLEEGYWRYGPLAEEYTFLYASPDGTLDGQSRFWDATDACCNETGRPVDDSGYLRGLVEEVEAQFNVDRDRIYFAGHSNGGFMSHRMACDHAEKVAAIASVAGTTFLDPARCKPVGPVHVLQVHGTADAVVFFAGGGGKPGVLETVERWAAKNGCVLTADTSGPPLNLDSSIPGDESTVAKYTSGCLEGGSAELWTIRDGGHFPQFITSGETMTFARLLVEWLLAHPKSPAPEASFSIKPGDGPAPLEVTVDGSASTTPEGTTITLYQWDFGDGTTAESAAPTGSHTYTEPGRYLITLTIRTNEGSRSAAKEQVVNVHCPPGNAAPWLTASFGANAFGGSARLSAAAGTLELCAGGRGLALSDNGFFVYQEVPGDFRISMRLAHFESKTFGQVGLMARLSLEDKAPLACVLLETSQTDTGGRFRARFRRTPGSSPKVVSGEGLATPAGWLRLERRGPTFVAQSSLDGTTWTRLERDPPLGSDLPLLSGPLLVGVAIAAKDDGASGFRPARARIEELDLGPIEPPIHEQKYRRGDTNSDGNQDLSDAIHALGFLFLGQPQELACSKSADFNDDGGMDISDPVSILGYLFLGAPAVPPEPFAACGVDPTVDGLGCETYPCRA